MHGEGQALALSWKNLGSARDRPSPYDNGKSSMPKRRIIDAEDEFHIKPATLATHLHPTSNDSTSHPAIAKKT